MIEENESESSRQDDIKRMTVMDIAKEKINERMLISDHEVQPMHEQIQNEYEKMDLIHTQGLRMLQKSIEKHPDRYDIQFRNLNSQLK